MKGHKPTLTPKINDFCHQCLLEFDIIPNERKLVLSQLSHYILGKIKTNEVPKLMVICTHNSRRSHIGQIWLACGADYFGLPHIETFSGGTEATAFNIRAVNSFQRIGFEISSLDLLISNPKYQIKWNEEMESYIAFSKKYNDSPNPKNGFAALMFCSEADVGCPVVLGSDFRLSLPYDDPKVYDDTREEGEKYDERVRQIGREILYALSLVNK